MISRFLDNILTELDTGLNNKQIELFMLHQQWLQEINIDNLTDIKIRSYKTEAILTSLGFSWSEITNDMISNTIKLLYGSDFC